MNTDERSPMLTTGKIKQTSFTSFADLAREIHRADIEAAKALAAKRAKR